MDISLNRIELHTLIRACAVTLSKDQAALRKAKTNIAAQAATIGATVIVYRKLKALAGEEEKPGNPHS